MTPPYAYYMKIIVFLLGYCFDTISYVKSWYDNHMFISYSIIRYNVYQYNNIKYNIASFDSYNITWGSLRFKNREYDTI